MLREARTVEKMRPVHENCRLMYLALDAVMPQVTIWKHPNSPHSTNSDLLKYLFQQQLSLKPHKNKCKIKRVHGYKSIPAFLAFVDECVCNFMTEPRPGCPLTMQQLELQKTSLEHMVSDAWLKWGRIFESDYQSADDEVRDMARKREDIRSWDAMDDQIEGTYAALGQWMPLKLCSDHEAVQKAREKSLRTHWNYSVHSDNV
eukprot:gnl/TRDRNA2_/TRDRNA2_101708_c0_seq2.p1 gnl/TRDRNA2_/TRDRNA2_101708_c0~~gnl/TRDRNA2_/TRDRNA2_101708_c0_seq2.p1  ORF type:complete len:203 (+),score=23.08 gnl/TRDRNA2_/TRDRNA2_101708_c0_seq2:128-736(+)